MSSRSAAESKASSQLPFQRRVSKMGTGMHQLLDLRSCSPACRLGAPATVSRVSHFADKTSNRSQESPQLTLERAMQLHAANKETFRMEKIMEENVSRQGSDGPWRGERSEIEIVFGDQHSPLHTPRGADRRMTLYTHSLLFCCPNELVAIDCIPAYQILDVCRYPTMNSEAGECMAITYIPSKKPPRSAQEHERIRSQRHEYETKTILCRSQKVDEWIRLVPKRLAT